MQWGESKEDLSCSSNIQLGHHLQFAKFSPACSEFDPRPPHSGSIGYYGLTTTVYIQCITFGFSPQVLLNVPLQVQKALSLIGYPIQLVLPCQSLV
jgi:hypothetical protein